MKVNHNCNPPILITAEKSTIWWFVSHNWLVRGDIISRSIQGGNISMGMGAVLYSTKWVTLRFLFVPGGDLLIH